MAGAGGSALSVSRQPSAALCGDNLEFCGMPSVARVSLISRSSEAGRDSLRCKYSVTHPSYRIILSAFRGGSSRTHFPCLFAPCHHPSFPSTHAHLGSFGPLARQCPCSPVNYSHKMRAISPAFAHLTPPAPPRPTSPRGPGPGPLSSPRPVLAPLLSPIIFLLFRQNKE